MPKFEQPSMPEERSKDVDKETDKEPKPENIGRVPDPELAQEMAEAEAPYHEKTLGVFPPSEKKIAKGERAAEQRRLQGIEITKSELSQEALEIVKEYKSRYKEGCKGGVWRIGRFFKIDPLVGEKITTYRIDGVVDLHDDYGHWVETDNGVLIIKMDGEKVVEVDEKNFMSRCIEKPSRGASRGYGGDVDDLLGRVP